MPRRKSPDTDEANAESPTFEAALSSLEEIVEAMEHEHLPLEDLVAHYEKGSALLTRCEALLQTAHGRIELITLRNQNEMALAASAKSLDAQTLPELEEPDDDDDDENDIRLF